MGAVIWIFVANWIRLVGCDFLWVGGCWSTGLLWVACAGCGEWFVGLLLSVAI